MKNMKFVILTILIVRAFVALAQLGGTISGTIATVNALLSINGLTTKLHATAASVNLFAAAVSIDVTNAVASAYLFIQQLGYADSALEDATVSVLNLANEIVNFQVSPNNNPASFPGDLNAISNGMNEISHASAKFTVTVTAATAHFASDLSKVGGDLDAAHDNLEEYATAVTHTALALHQFAMNQGDKSLLRLGINLSLIVAAVNDINTAVLNLRAAIVSKIGVSGSASVVLQIINSDLTSMSNALTALALALSSF